jgi:hypothetical protein
MPLVDLSPSLISFTRLIRIPRIGYKKLRIRRRRRKTWKTRLGTKSNIKTTCRPADSTKITSILGASRRSRMKRRQRP